MSKFASGASAALVALGLMASLSSPPAVMAESNGVGLMPAMGWSSWSFLRAAPTAPAVQAQAKAMVRSGLARVGYEYVNVDPGWYSCPGAQGPAVDRYGRWDIDANGFPSHGSVSGIKAVADYVHHLGLKFGLYVTPGISEQAVARNTVIKGTRSHADDIFGWCRVSCRSSGGTRR
jgi:Alpha galactosidase A